MQLVGSQDLEPRMPPGAEFTVQCSNLFCSLPISKHTGRGDRFRNRSCLSPMCWDMVAVVSPTVSPWCRAFSQTPPLAIQTARPCSGTVSHLLILLSVFSPQRSSQTPPVRPISCTPALTLVALRRIKQKTLECRVPGS